MPCGTQAIMKKLKQHLLLQYSYSIAIIYEQNVNKI